MSSAAGKRKMSLSAVALRVGLAGLLLYLVVSLVYVQIDIVSKRQQLDNLTQQVAVQQAQNQEPVSYTHLDVYKRQVFYRIGIHL